MTYPIKITLLGYAVVKSHCTMIQNIKLLVFEIIFHILIIQKKH